MLIKIGAKKIMIGDLQPPTSLCLWGAPAPGSGFLQIKFPYRTDYRVSLVSVSESGSQRVKYAIVKVPNSLRILSIKSTISQKSENCFS